MFLTALEQSFLDEGKAEGEERNQAKIDNQINEALQADPTMSLAEFKKQFLNKQKKN